MSWSLPTPPAVAGPYVFGTSNNSGHFLFAARNGAIIYSTDDGVTWTIGTNPLTGGECYGCKYSHGRWFVWGNNGTNAAVAYATSLATLSSAPTYRTGSAGDSFLYFAGDADVANFGLITNASTPILHYTQDDLGSGWLTLTSAIAFNPQFLVRTIETGAVACGWISSGSGSNVVVFMDSAFSYDFSVPGDPGFMGGTAIPGYVCLFGEGDFLTIDTAAGGGVSSTTGVTDTGKQLDQVYNFTGASGVADVVVLSSFDEDARFYADDTDFSTFTDALSSPAHTFTTGVAHDGGALYAWGDGLLVGDGRFWVRLYPADTGAPATYTEIGAAASSAGTFIAIYNQSGADVIVVRHAAGGSLDAAAPLIATSTVEGYLRKVHELEGSIAAVSALAGDIDTGNTLDGSITVTATLIAAASMELETIGSLAATSSLSGAVLLGSDNVAIPTVGLLEAITDAVGSADNEIGGINATRMTVAGAIGETSIAVETAYLWADTGKISIDGIVYQYTSKTDTTISGIEHVSAGATVTGLKRAHVKQSVVLDLSQTRSALDKVRRAMLVEYAEGADLNVLGRNLGVLRPPALSDDDRFREIIKAIAYNPRGTMYGIELALTGIVGAGNFTIFEDLISNKCKVFISLQNDALASDSAAGKAYLSGSHSYAISGANDQIDLTGEDLAVQLKSIQGVRLKNESLTTTTRTARPSADLITEYDGDTPRAAWAYTGVTAENTNVTLIADDGGVSRLAITTANAAMYHRYARVQPESSADFAVMLSIPTGSTLNTNANQIAIQIRDGARSLNVGITTASVSTYNVGFCDNTALGAFIAGSAIVLDMGTYYEIGIRKRGDWVYLIVNGNIVQTLARSSFTASVTLPSFSFGAYPNGTATTGAQVRFSSMRCWAKTTTDYWPRRGLAASVQTTDPDRINTGAADTFGLTSEGKQVRVSGSAITNAQGGNNNGRFFVKTVLSDTIAVLEGRPQKSLSTSIANPTRIVTAEHSFKFPQDLGKKVTISGSALGNDGTYVISALLDDLSLVDLSTYSTVNEVWTNVAELVGAAFQTESDLDWQLDPNFQLEAGLDWEVSDAGEFASDIITLPAAMPYAATTGFPVVVDLFATEVLSAQVLVDNTLTNEVIATTPSVLYEYYPFYLSDPLGVVRVFLDELTAAGVIPEYRLT
jgi:hypothetical protein